MMNTLDEDDNDITLEDLEIVVSEDDAVGATEQPFDDIDFDYLPAQPPPTSTKKERKTRVKKEKKEPKLVKPKVEKQKVDYQL